MNDYIEIQDSYDRGRSAVSSGSLAGPAALSGVMTRVYVWMTAALCLTGATAFLTVSSPSLLQLIYGNAATMWVLIIAELALVMAMSAGLRRFSATTATVCFLLYAVVNGFVLSSIFFAYELGSIVQAFAASALTFGAMSIYGATTKKDLSGLGSILFMALIGLIIASLINFFWANSVLDAIITYAGVFIFVGLTAYDTQNIRSLAAAADYSGDASAPRKVAILGALTLYLDFINLFLYILRLFGRSRD